MEFKYYKSISDDVIIIEETKHSFRETAKKPSWIEKLFGVTWEKKVKNAQGLLEGRVIIQDCADREREEVVKKLINS